MSRSFSRDDMIGAFFIGLFLGAIIIFILFQVSVLDPIQAAENERRLEACLATGYSGVIDENYFAQVKTLDRSYLGCVKREVVNGTTVTSTHWIPYSSYGG